MSLGLSLTRLLVILGGICLIVLGIYLVVLPGTAGSITGLWTVLLGAALVIGALIERIRYRNESVDRNGTPAGVAGGEPPGTVLEARFHLFPLSGVEHERDADVGHKPRREFVHVFDAVTSDEIHVHIQHVRAFAFLFPGEGNQAVPVFGIQQIAHLL